MDPGRLKRKEEISKALKFIQSSLAFPDPEGYQDFLIGLVCNLLEEGNALFKDRSWVEAVKEFSEGLNVAQYAASEDIHIQAVLLESLYVNRAATYYSLQEFGRGVEDCDSALSLCKDSRRALYRKALCLKELGKYKEAYSCTTECLLINRMDNQVNELAQELAVHLGLKTRKPYLGAKQEDVVPQVVTNGKITQEPICSENAGTATSSLSAVSQGSSSSQDETFLTAEGCSQPADFYVSEIPNDSELMGEDLDSLLDAFSNVSGPSEPHLQAFSALGFMSSSPHSVSSGLPDPTPQLPPAFFTSTSSQLNSVKSSLATGNMVSTFDALDDVSSSANICALNAPSKIVHESVTSKIGLSMPQHFLDDLDSLDDIVVPETTAVEVANSISEKSIEQALEIQHKAATNGFKSDTPLNTVDCLDSLDALDTFPSLENVAAMGLDSLSDLKLNDGSNCVNSAPLKTDSKATSKHCPTKESQGLTSTHQFKQACKACYPRMGKGIYTFVHKPTLVHNCQKDILLCREKNSVLPWTRVRRRPVGAYFTGPFVLCKEILESGDLGVCKFGEDCTFAYNQLEIDVWTEERKGKFDREMLFEKPGMKQDPVKSIIKILEENKGMFIFLCGACFDGKPTIISKRSKGDVNICSNVDVRHLFEANKCLVFMIGTIAVRYRKIRTLHRQCQLDLCRHSIRYGCQLGDRCKFAHSDVELKAWRLQRETETTPEEMVKISTNHYEKLRTNISNKQQQQIKPLCTNKPKGGKPEERLKMRMRFVCGHCWRDGVASDPDKALKYCSAKAKHMWTKDKRILLVKSLERERSKWVMVRTLPHCKHFPLHYDICHRILNKGRCNVGNCTFAHSQEEKDMWTYMKNNTLVDMQQVYDMWLTQLMSAHNHQKDEPAVSQGAPEEKCIVMPTDYAEPMDGFHCRLCGKHSNSEKQWQQHISSEKHKDRVFSFDEEDKALTWNYRFPAKFFDLCPRLEDNCPDGMSCDYAHSLEELQEWTERRDFLRRKLDIAKEDMLIMPDESDFGKYNFLLHDNQLILQT